MNTSGNTIDGSSLSRDICNELKKEIQMRNIQAKMCIVCVGKNKANAIYVKRKIKIAQEIGIETMYIEKTSHTSEEELLQTIYELNTNNDIHGYIIQLPLPKHIHSEKIFSHIDPKKDIDGFHPINQGKLLLGEEGEGFFCPCTPAGIQYILLRNFSSLKGKFISVIGKSNIVGKPLSALLINAGATLVSCNSHTQRNRLIDITKKSDIVIIAIGKEKFLKKNMLGKHTVVIDVGIQKSKDDGKICGDADFDEIVGYNRITPVPGGVGPMTVAMLMKNVVKAYNISQNSQKKTLT